MSDERKTPVWAWIAALLVGLPVLYVASFGPACWISERTGIGSSAISVVYQPMLRIWMSNTYAGLAVIWYAKAGTKEGSCTISRSRADGWLTIGWSGMM